MDKEILIDVEHVSRYYGEHCAVNNISFQIQRGEVVGFLGPNGAGKTTSMQMISGVLAANAGQIKVAGIDIVDQPTVAKSNIGFLPESPPLYRDLTVDEYLQYAGRLRKLTGKTLLAAIENAKQRCGISDVAGRLLGNLSKGYQQRVGIAQAIIHSPSVVILDEPTSGLDPNQIIEIRDLIRELGNDHSVILSTHILPEVQTVCDRVIIINQGQLVLDESLAHLANREQQQWISRFNQPIDIHKVSSLSSVQNVIEIDGHKLEITLKPETHDLNEFIALVAEQRWNLQELTPSSSSLEHTFMKLTQNTTGVH